MIYIVDLMRLKLKSQNRLTSVLDQNLYHRVKSKQESKYLIPVYKPCFY